MNNESMPNLHIVKEGEVPAETPAERTERMLRETKEGMEDLSKKTPEELEAMMKEMETKKGMQ